MRLIILFIICNSLWHHSNAVVNVAPGKKTKRTYKKKKVENSQIGKVIDKLNGVNIYYNGSIGHVAGRNKTADGYNLGLKYQCVEFVKRYYYEVYNHKMPNSYGHAREFFNKSARELQSYNRDRALMQYRNGCNVKPKVGDIFVFDANANNQFGHIGVVSMVGSDRVEMVQQNVGKHTRNMYLLHNRNGNFEVEEPDLLGWMRKT